MACRAETTNDFRGEAPGSGGIGRKSRHQFTGMLTTAGSGV